MQNLSMVLDKVMAAMVDSIRDSNHVADSFLDHRLAKTCQESGESQGLLTSMYHINGMSKESINSVSALLQFAVVSSYLLRKADMTVPVLETI